MSGTDECNSDIRRLNLRLKFSSDFLLFWEFYSNSNIYIVYIIYSSHILLGVKMGLYYKYDDNSCRNVSLTFTRAESFRKQRQCRVLFYRSFMSR